MVTIDIVIEELHSRSFLSKALADRLGTIMTQLTGNLKQDAILAIS